MKKIIRGINKNAIIRNLILALCLFIVFIFSLSFLLDIFTRHNQYIKVPTFEGLSLTQANALATSNSLILEVNDSVHVRGAIGGTIVDQNPKPNREVKAGRHISLTVTSYNKTMVTIPYITGYSLRQAKNNLQIAGLGISKLIYKTDIATNNILEQQYNGSVITKSSDIMTEVGSKITLIVGKSRYAAPCIIPDVLGLTLAEAQSRLWEVGLNVAGEDPELTAKARVYTQQPKAGKTRALGGVITLKLTQDEEKVKLALETAKKEKELILKIKMEEKARLDSLNQL